MHETTPKVYLIAEPRLVDSQLDSFLASQGVPEQRRWTSDAEELCAAAGRICYKSWLPGLNPNVTQVRRDTHDYLRNIIKQGHGAVLEHAQFTFLFEDVSRVLTHELVRHRAGVAISQESLRYVRLTDIGFRLPDSLEPYRPTVLSIIEQVEDLIYRASEDLDRPGVNFHTKKEVTSALRRIAPMGLSTNIMWSANVRTIRHVIKMRTSQGAEEEIRSLFHDVAKLMITRYPGLFGDLKINVTNGCIDSIDDPTWY